jgi:hypothetical protein
MWTAPAELATFLVAKRRRRFGSYWNYDIVAIDETGVASSQQSIGHNAISSYKHTFNFVLRKPRD